MRKLLLVSSFMGLFMIGCTKQNSDPFANVKPDESRFTKVTLVEKLNEPMELEVLNNLDVLIIERAGKIRLYQNKTGNLIEVGFLEVYPEREDGLMGLAKDPNFEINHWIYLYYAPPNTSINRLSRFDFKNNIVDLTSEKIILEIPVYRDCCHSGGSLEFDAHGNLFLSLGDDSTPFESINFNPIDERMFRPENVDAQRSSGNTNDLRGSIIRIHPEADGTYTIPEGNLFPVGTEGTRPEIYVMGNRNPFRIAIDQHNDNLFWGEVGPDASASDSSRGPKGYDEYNLATKPGFYGWPYFVGDNKSYWKFDFEKQESLFLFDPEAPINTSPRNTGLQNLPPAQKPLIWYPYDESVEFPMLGTGGRNAMAGPVYYREDYEDSEVRFPGYYNGKSLFYDWMRNWIFMVSLTENNELDTLERFMPSTVFDKPVDMQYGPDGALYVLEYGTFWRSQNDDSGLYRIEFAAGNRKPSVKISADKQSGTAPLEVRFSSEGTVDVDEGDQLTYQWDFDGEASSSEKNPTFKFEKAGEYTTTLTVTDQSGASTAESIDILVGNEAPTVSIDWGANKSFYFGNETVMYEVRVSDKEDTSISDSDINFSIDYLQGGYDIIQTGPEEEVISLGEALINQSGCIGCHAMENKSVGPTYSEVSKKYADDTEAKSYLTNKIINGGSGVWGDTQMPGHVHLEKDKVEEMVEFILSYSNPNSKKIKLPLSGSYKLDEPVLPDSYYLIQASYEDKGANGIGALKTSKQLILRSPKISPTIADEFVNVAKSNENNSRFIKFTEKESYFSFKNLDLSGIESIDLEVNPGNISGKIEIRSGGVDGVLIGESKLLDSKQMKKGEDWFVVSIPIQKIANPSDVYFILKTESGISIWSTFNINSMEFNQ
ncbi:PQQ-dependent sugar dehydrogenase [Algoriphagus sp. SE2]|uniref:PQQ-dependent sugar dehydrogenase n=1 Tax=Algoriphagus sp. SE2 TaxID=3141536 RepID=UPI0031CD8769